MVTQESAMLRIAEAYGHVSIPADVFTTDDYVRILAAQNPPVHITKETARRTLTRAVQAGLLDGRKVKADGGSARWIFWPLQESGQEPRT